MESFLNMVLTFTCIALVLTLLRLRKVYWDLRCSRNALAACRSEIATSKKEVESARELIASLDDKVRAQHEDLDKVERFMDWAYGCGILFMPKEKPDSFDERICQLIKGIEDVDVTISKATKSEAHLVALINDAYNEALKHHEGCGAITDKPATMLVYLRNTACQVEQEQKRWEEVSERHHKLLSCIRDTARVAGLGVSLSAEDTVKLLCKSHKELVDFIGKEYSAVKDLLKAIGPMSQVAGMKMADPMSQVAGMKIAIDRVRKSTVKNLECLKPVLQALVEHGALEKSDLVPNAEETSIEQMHIGRELAVNGVCTLGVQANEAKAKLTMIRSILDREGNHFGDLSKHGSIPGGQRTASPGDERANGHAG